MCPVTAKLICGWDLTCVTLIQCLGEEEPFYSARKVSLTLNFKETRGELDFLPALGLQGQLCSSQLILNNIHAQHMKNSPLKNQGLVSKVFLPQKIVGNWHRKEPAPTL